LDNFWGRWKVVDKRNLTGLFWLSAQEKREVFEMREISRCRLVWLKGAFGVISCFNIYVDMVSETFIFAEKPFNPTSLWSLRP